MYKQLSQPGPGENRQWRLIQPIAREELIGAEHFEFVTSARPVPGPGEVLLQTVCLGTSPAQRSYVTTSISMHDKVCAGEVMRGRGVGRVVVSHSTDYAPGDLVVATTGWQDYSVHNPTAAGPFALAQVSTPELPGALALGVLGGAGITAYFGLIDVGQVKPDDVVVVSAAAGGVGSCAVQIARRLGCRVIGIAGGENKCRWLRETLGVEQTIDYKAESLSERLDEICPAGIDVFFDNVGGDQLEAVLERLTIGARVVICGYISTDYEPKRVGPKNYVYLLRRRARMEGFFVFDYQDRFPEALGELEAWFRAGDLIDNTDPLYGLEQMPDALRSLFEGANTGVRVCQVAPDEHPCVA